MKLRGRLDTPGVDRVEAKFTSAVVPEARNTVVDLSEVAFIASMGLRMFIGLAKSASDASDFFQIPTGRVMEVGTQVTV